MSKKNWREAITDTKNLKPGDNTTTEVNGGVPHNPLDRMRDVMRASNDGDGVVAVITNGSELKASRRSK